MPFSRARDLSDTAEPATTRPVPPAMTRARPAGAVFAQPLVPMLTAGAVAILVLLGVGMARSADLIVALWAANGLAAAVWLRSGRGLGFDLSFGGLMAMGLLVGEFLAGNGPGLALMFMAANMIEIVGAVLLARRFAPALSFSTVEGACRFMLATALIAPIPAALIGAGILALVRGAPFLVGFQTWWFGHALGLAVIAPMVLAINRRALLVFRQPWKLLEWVGLMGVLALASYLICFRLTTPSGYFIVPILILIAARLRIPGITIALAVIAMAAVSTVLNNTAPINAVTTGMSERMLTVQLMLLFGCLPIVLVASLLEERDTLADSAQTGRRRAELASEAKSRLLANVAHEIKSPVAGVIGIGELWSTGQLGAVTATQKEMADMLVKTARQVETLAHDLLDVARAESGAVKVELRPVDVPGVIEDVRRAAALRPEARGLRIEAASEGEGLVALADSQRLTQVVDNLTTNAIKYGGAGGVVLFRVLRVREGVRIEITDHGPGLSLDKQAQLFEPFNRLGLERSSIEGHGIGLALAKRLVELQGGEIGIVSAPGEGATFWIELPAA